MASKIIREGYTFDEGADATGRNVRVSYKSWSTAPVRQVFISKQALIGYALHCLREERIAELQNASTEELARMFLR